MKYSIISLNICLGVFSKLSQLSIWINELSPDFLFIQECEITESNVCHIKIKNYALITTDIKRKSRLCVFIKQKLLQKLTCKISSTTEAILLHDGQTQIVGFYRPFKLTCHSSQQSYMEDFISFLRSNLSYDKHTVIIGDFNLDHNKLQDLGYAHRKIYDLWLSFVDEFGLVQNIQEITWRRLVKNKMKESTLDHCYSNFEISCDIFDSLLSDHSGLIISDGIGKQNKNYSTSYKRIWKGYSACKLRSILRTRPLERFNYMSVEQTADFLDLELMSALQKLAPKIEIKPRDRKYAWSDKLLRIKKQKRNLLEKSRRTKNKALLKRARKLDKLFKSTIIDEKRFKIRKNINFTDPKSLWNAVKIADDSFGTDEIQQDISFGNRTSRSNEEKAEMFASYFEDKIANLKVNDIPESCYDGMKLVDHKEFDPFTLEKISIAFKQTKPKNSYGHDRVPMRLLLDLFDVLKGVVFGLFQKFFDSGVFPSKWKISRIMPLLKKGNPQHIENYRPISNICSLAKVFERCLLNELKALEEEENVDLTGINQHGFKGGKSTTTLALDLQHEIASALQYNKVVGLVSLDLSAAFDTIDKNRLLHRLSVLGLNPKIVDLIKGWLVDRYSYVDCDGSFSAPYLERWGTPQGSVLGPTLFSLYMRPLLDLDDEVRMYADDNYFLVCADDSNSVISSLELKLHVAQEWLKKSDLIVNLKKTEFIVFENNKQNNYEIDILGEKIKNKNSVNVLGILFDSKLNWSNHIEKVISTSKKDCFMLKKLGPFFLPEELSKIMTAMIFSKFYYGAVIWLNPFNLKSNSNRLLSASTNLIKSAFNLPDWNLVNRFDIHVLANRATPNMMSNYLSANTIASILTNKFPPKIYSSLINNVLVNDRNGLKYFPDCSKKRVGLNMFSNRFAFISKKLPFNWNEMTRTQFKKLSKQLFINHI